MHLLWLELMSRRSCWLPLAPVTMPFWLFSGSKLAWAGGKNGGEEENSRLLGNTWDTPSRRVQRQGAREIFLPKFIIEGWWCSICNHYFFSHTPTKLQKIVWTSFVYHSPFASRLGKRAKRGKYIAGLAGKKAAQKKQSVIYVRRSLWRKLEKKGAGGGQSGRLWMLFILSLATSMRRKICIRRGRKIKETV